MEVPKNLTVGDTHRDGRTAQVQSRHIFFEYPPGEERQPLNRREKKPYAGL